MKEEAIMQRRLLAFAIIALAPACALAQMSCAALGSYLASQPHISQYVPPLPQPQTPVPFTQLLTTGGITRCEANFIYSSRGGPADGYAIGQNQRIGIRVGFPLNSADNGGAPSSWNGKVRNIGGGGLQGGLSAITTATNAGYVGSNTDTGHPTQDNPNFPVIQDTHELNYGRLDDFLRESIHQQYKWALALTEAYYGTPATRNYWDGCSTGGREGLSLALNFGQDFDGFLTGAPANFHTRLQVATVWPFWVQKELTGTATLTQAKMNAANASAVAACDEQNGLKDGILSDSRTCHFDATNNICDQLAAVRRPVRQPRHLLLVAPRHHVRLHVVAAFRVRQRDRARDRRRRALQRHHERRSRQGQGPRREDPDVARRRRPADPVAAIGALLRQGRVPLQGIREPGVVVPLLPCARRHALRRRRRTAAAEPVRRDGELGRERQCARFDHIDERDARQPADVPVSAGRP